MRTRSLAALAGMVAALVLPAPAAAAPAGGRVIVMRPGYAELVQGGVVRRYVPLPRRAVTIATLVRAVRDPSWIGMSARGEVTLRAGISQRPGTELYVRAPARTLRLVDSATSPAYLSGTRARVHFQGVTVTSASGASGPARESAHRPYVRYLNRSTISVVSSVFEGLGAASTRNHGVTIGAGGVLSAVDSEFRAGSRGIDVYRAARVTLTRVRATGNTEAGLLVNQAGALRLTDVATSENTGTGLVLRGPVRAATLTRVSSGRNWTGAELSRLGDLPITALRTEHNRRAGIVLDRCPGCVLAGAAAEGDRIGVVVKRHSPAAVVEGGSVRAARQIGVMVAARGVRLRGISVESAPGAVGLRVPSGAPDARVEAGTFRGGAVAISTDGARTTIVDAAVTDARIGVRVGGDATSTSVSGARMAGTRTGVQANTGAGEVRVDHLHVVQAGGQGVRSAARGISVTDSQVDGAVLAMHLKGTATVRASRLSATDEALFAGPDARVTFAGGRLGGGTLGVHAHDSADVLLEDTTVDAPTGARGPVRLRGTTDLPGMPVRWIALLGLLVIGAAIALEVVRRLREHRTERTVSAPAHVTNTT